MKRTHCILLSISLLVLLILTLIFLPGIKDAQLGDIQAVWGRVRQAGAYHFAVDILQTTTPLPSVTNVGRQSRQEALHIEGQANLPERTLNLTLWSQGGSLFNAADGARIRVDDQRAYAQQGAGDWQEIDDFTGLFAPEGDALAYLAAARDVVSQGRQTRAGITFSRYTFRIDGRSFAALIRDQMERQLSEKGELPPGVELELPRVYVDMTGRGELWVGTDGLPLRQILELQFPATEDDRVEARIDVTFSEFGADLKQTASIFNLGTLFSPPSLQQAGGFVFALGLLALIPLLWLLSRRSFFAASLILVAARPSARRSRSSSTITSPRTSKSVS